jgi:prevent-host-death family protein
MKAAGVRELKNRLSQFLKAVQGGETILVTDRGEVVAQLAPPPRFVSREGETEDAALERLVQAGRLRRGSGRFFSEGEERLSPPSGPIDISAALRVVRTDRS